MGGLGDRRSGEPNRRGERDRWRGGGDRDRDRDRDELRELLLLRDELLELRPILALYFA